MQWTWETVPLSSSRQIVCLDSRPFFSFFNTVVGFYIYCVFCSKYLKYPVCVLHMLYSKWKICKRKRNGIEKLDQFHDRHLTASHTWILYVPNQNVPKLNIRSVAPFCVPTATILLYRALCKGGPVSWRKSPAWIVCTNFCNFLSSLFFFHRLYNQADNSYYTAVADSNGWISWLERKLYWI